MFFLQLAALCRRAEIQKASRRSRTIRKRCRKTPDKFRNHLRDGYDDESAGVRRKCRGGDRGGGRKKSGIWISVAEGRKEVSEIYQLNSSGSREVSEETLSVIKRALEIAVSPTALFDPSIAPAADLWGFLRTEFPVPSLMKFRRLFRRSAGKNFYRRNVTLPGTKSTWAESPKAFFRKIDGDLSDHGVETGIVSLGETYRLGEKTDEASEGVALQDPDDPDCYLSGAAESVA